MTPSYFQVFERFEHAHADDANEQAHDHPRGQDNVRVEKHKGERGLRVGNPAPVALKAAQLGVVHGRVRGLAVAPTPVRVPEVRVAPEEGRVGNAGPGGEGRDLEERDHAYHHAAEPRGVVGPKKEAGLQEKETRINNNRQRSSATHLNLWAY